MKQEKIIQKITKRKAPKPPKPSFSCEICKRVFTRKDNLNVHLKKSHSENLIAYICKICSKTYSHAKNCKKHIREHHKLPPNGQFDTETRTNTSE